MITAAEMKTFYDPNNQNKAAAEAARVGVQMARASADMARRSSEITQERMQVSLNTVSKGFEHMADQATKVLGFNGPQAQALAQRSSENVKAVAEASTVLVRGAREVSQEVLALVQDGAQKNAEAVNQLAGVRSVQDFVAVQSDLARDRVQQVIDTNKRIAEVVLRAATEAGRIIQAQANQNAPQARDAA